MKKLVKKRSAIYYLLIFVVVVVYRFYPSDIRHSRIITTTRSSFSYFNSESKKEQFQDNAIYQKAKTSMASSDTTVNVSQSQIIPKSDLKIILMWNAWTPRMADKPLVKGQCPIRSCLFTTDMSLIEQSDVVVLHFDTLEDFPVNRQPHQRFVFYHFESPENTASNLMEHPLFRYDYFNWTMTYRRDSDIYLRDYYGSLVAKTFSNIEERYNFNIIANNIVAASSSNFTALIRGKTKMVAWFVGHCKTHVRREEYARQLSKYISVDVFGNCTKECPSFSCDEMLRTDYKFYLSFENSWCPDYVTEKFIRPFLFDTVPIVLGGADYSKFAPSHSYINARDFKSPKELAEYLLLLNNSEYLYTRYFTWKNDYVISVPDMFGWCELCRMAHDATLPTKTYHDIKKWWMLDGGECESNTTYYF